MSHNPFKELKESKEEKGGKKKSGGFQSMGLDANVFRGITKTGYKVPTPIQRKCIPTALEGRDIVAMARTGSGKTAAFLIPMLQKLKEHKNTMGARGLILSPTRELAMQTLKFFQKLARYTDLRACLLVGGDSMGDQFASLAANPDVIIGTPGRLRHMLSEVDNLSLRLVEYVVFDEGDRLFEMGFQDDIREIVNQCSSHGRQTLLFSATLPTLLVAFARAGLNNPVTVRLDADQQLSENLKIEFFSVRNKEKDAALMYLLKEFIPAGKQVLVFAATRHHVEYLCALLTQLYQEPKAVCIYGRMDQSARKINLTQFSKRKADVMFVTDLAARGIDIPILDVVINYDFPPKPKIFVHRVGRVARAGRSGEAYSLVGGDEVPFVYDLMLFLGRKLVVAKTKEPNSGKTIGSTTTKKGTTEGEIEGTHSGVEPNENVEHASSVEELGNSTTITTSTTSDVTNNTMGPVSFGCFPQIILERHFEEIDHVLNSTNELQRAQRTMMNAYKLYYKTRNTPSHASVKRAKDVSRENIHPLWVNYVDSVEAARCDFLKQLKDFRPAQTVFEVKIQEPTKASTIMERKRQLHGEIIAKERDRQKKKTQKQQRQATIAAEDSPDSGGKIGYDGDDADDDDRNKRKLHLQEKTEGQFRDDKFFLSNTPSNHYTELGLQIDKEKGTQNIEDMVLDLIPDDAKSIFKTKTISQWDRRRKKYIQVTQGHEKQPKFVKNESGQLVKASEIPKGKHYKEWMQKSKKVIGKEGELEADTSKTVYDENKKRVYQRYKVPTKTASDVADELKSKEQIKKAHREKERKQAKSKGKGKGQKRKRNPPNVPRKRQRTGIRMLRY